MSVDIRLPNITGATPESQISQLKSYLYQMVEQLNWALNTIRSEENGSKTGDIVTNGSASSDDEAQNTFNSIKSLIIKSADIVNVYKEELDRIFAGEYVAQSDFGTYTENTLQEIGISPTAIAQSYTDIQTLQTNLGEFGDKILSVEANIRTGLLEYDDQTGAGVYGVEVGQRTEEDGEEVFNKYARFTADRLSFYDQNGSEVGYISDYKLYITDAVILGDLQIGGYILNTSSGIAIKWVGR